jgi:hypothetical protein
MYMLKQYIKRIIVTDWSLIDQSSIPVRHDHYTAALEWLSEHSIYTSDLTMEGLMGMVASHSILFDNTYDLLAFTLVYGDLIQ